MCNLCWTCVAKFAAKRVECLLSTNRKIRLWQAAIIPSSETQGQSVASGEKARRKFSSTGEKAPGYRLSPNYFQNFKPMPAPNWAQKMLCIIVPNRRTVFPEFFSWVRTRRLLSWSRLVWMHQRNARSQQIKSRSDFKILSARKLKTLFQKYKLELTTGIYACIGHASDASCVNTREFLKDTTTADSNENVAWKSEFPFFQSLSWLFQLAYFVKWKWTLLELNFY